VVSGAKGTVCHQVRVSPFINAFIEVSVTMDHEQMFALLQSDEPESQREGAFMAGEAMDRETIPYLTAMLSSPNLGVQDAADMSLRKIGGREVVDALLPLLRSENVSTRNLAMDILRQIGSHHVEPIIALLEDPDPDVRIFASDILGSTNNYMAVAPLCDALLHDEEVNVRYQAAVSLGELGKPEATEALNKALGEDDWVNFAVIEALMKIGDDDSITALMDALDHSSELVASIIVDALGKLGHIRAVPVLVQYLDKSTAALRNKTLKAIVNIMGSKALSLLSDDERASFAGYLLAAADDEDKEIQDAVIMGLSGLGGPEASRKIFALATRIDPETEADRYARAVNGLVSLGLTPALCEGSRSDDERVSQVALDVLIRLGTPEAAKACMDVFWDKGRDLQRFIARGIAGTACKEDKDFFLRVLQESTDGDLLKSALKFLGIRMRFKDTTDAIIPFLQHRFADVREMALDACVALGGKKVEDVLATMLHSTDASQRRMGIYGLGKLNATKHEQEFEQALSDEAVDVRKMAMEVLIALCAGDDELLARIATRMLHDPSVEVRRSLVNLLGSTQCPGAMVFLVDALEDEDNWVQIRAVESLGRLGRQEAIPSLVALLERDNPLVCIKVVKTLGQIGGKRAFQELLKVLGTENREIQEAAEQALDRIQSDSGEVF
jgi:HEAT repeat protein